MKFFSNQNKNISAQLSAAIQMGLASDGGLFVPEYFPKINLSDFPPHLEYHVFANKLLNEFFKDDPLSQYLEVICKSAFNFELPLQKINQNTAMLDLCNGPTLSFKDFGARFLAECINYLSTNYKTTIMVATSGDTGSAVASAFYKKENVDVIILYPKGKISKKQEHQLTCWGDNVLSLAVCGTFDDCQKLVKEAFKEDWWQRNIHLSSANSINIGRLLPQIVYYAFSSVQYFKQFKTSPGYIIPTGNLGNATAAFWAKQMGFPIREIILATNENRVLEDYIITGEFKPHKSVSTLANAMDVGNPSNFARLINLYPSFNDFKNNVSVFRASDSQIKDTIIEIYQKYKIIICPHTATAFFARNQLSNSSWIVVATADPCKFDDIIEPIIHNKVPSPSQMLKILQKETSFIEIQPSLGDIKKIVLKKLKN